MGKSAVSRRVVGLLVIGVVLVVMQHIGVLRPLTTALSVVTEPFQNSLSGFGASTANFFGVAGSIGSLASQNRQLTAQVSVLKQQLSQDTELKAQNAALKQQLGVGTVQPDRLVAAQVIGYQPDNFRQFITISRGGRDGLKPGMAVVEHGVLVGTIAEVAPTTAKVFLVIDPNFRVAALDQDQATRPSGTIHGQIGSGLEMSNIAQTDIVKQGDTVVTSGLGGDVEKGLIVGHVQSVSKQDNGVFQTAQVTTNIQFNHLEIIYVVVRPQ